MPQRTLQADLSAPKCRLVTLRYVSAISKPRQVVIGRERAQTLGRIQAKKAHHAAQLEFLSKIALVVSNNGTKHIP